MASLQPNPVIPRNSTALVRQRWLELLDLSRATCRVTQGELETGVHAIVAPGCSLREDKRGALTSHLLTMQRGIPKMARGIRFSLGKVDRYGAKLEDDFRQWMGQHGKEIASGTANAVVFVDLAYLEAALLDRVFESGVQVDFNVPITMFRRGELIDYANVLDVAARMVFEGRSLMDAASRLARETLDWLETYASAFWKLSGLYTDARWRIQHNNFIMELPRRGISLTLHYWELHDGETSALETWQRWIESLLEEAPLEDRGHPTTFAA